MNGRIRVCKDNYYLLVIACFISILVAVTVYLTGGTSKVYSHLMYVPIAVVSSVYGRKWGVFQGIFCSLLLGPFMPLDVSQGIAQQPINWIMRLGVFILISLIIGFFSDYNQKQSDHVAMILTHNMSTGLKNLEAIMNETETQMTNRTIAVVNVRGISSTINIFGYNFRNEIMKSLAARLKELVNDYDNVELYHYSELKFILKINESQNGVDKKTILKNIANMNRSILRVENIPFYIEIQMGIAYIDGKTSTYEGLRRALIACSNAELKLVRMVEFNNGLESYYKSVFEVANEFSEALTNNKVNAAFQKVVTAESEEVYALEILTRWRKEDGTSIRPDFFIPIIEKTELIHELTKFIISQAMILLSNDENCVVSINFSQKDFSDECIEYLIESARNSHVDPSRIQIEIIERTLSNVKELSRYLKRLKEYNIKIALDDFGTGYSSYYYASELPIDVIKIDKSLIKNLVKNTTTRSLVESVVRSYNMNNIKTVAEGVETKEIADVCKEIGFDYLQGYYYHKPQMM